MNADPARDLRSVPFPVTLPPLPDHFTQAATAKRFAWQYADRLRYVYPWQTWVVRGKHHWRRDDTGQVRRYGLEAAKSWQHEALGLLDVRRRDDALKAALALERKANLDAMIDLARCLEPLADDGTQWDRDPWLLGCPNGVVDLRDGNLRDGRPVDRITLQTAVEYDPAARSDLWSNALREILVTDALIDFVQVAAGYSATGDTRRDCWFVGVGSGRNGKGTLYHPIRRALGEYATELPATVFDARRDHAPFDLAVLPGKRFVLSSESGDTIRLNHDLIKQLSGGDPVRAANKYERSFEFQPMCKLWLSANRKPRVADDSPAFWERVMLIPFLVSFAGREDRNLRPALELEDEHQRAILAWVVKGATRYASAGLEPPPEVRAATGAYQDECDLLLEFLQEACQYDPAECVGASDLYAHYRAWAERQGLSDRERLTRTQFGRKCSSKFESKKDHATGVKYYLGLAPRRLF